MECAAFMIPGTGITRPGPCCSKPHERNKVVCQEFVKSDRTQKISCTNFYFFFFFGKKLREVFFFFFFFCKKLREAFASQKLFTIFRQKRAVFLHISVEEIAQLGSSLTFGSLLQFVTKFTICCLIGK